jgi:hypothetical protein
MDEGLRTGEGLGVEFDVSDLLRMDTDTQVRTSKEAVSAGIMAPNEARYRLNLRPVQGGETPWLQQQNWPMARLAERTLPTAGNPNPAPDDQPQPADDEDDDGDAAQRAFWGAFADGFREAA